MDINSLKKSFWYNTIIFFFLFLISIWDFQIGNIFKMSGFSDYKQKDSLPVSNGWPDIYTH